MNSAVVLIACGSFNPITRMHFGMFQLAKNYFEKNKIKFLKGLISPTHDNYFIKKGKLVPSTVRAEMINLAIDEFNRTNQISNSWLICDQWESSRADWSRTIEVLHHFKEMIKFGSFNDSKNYDEIQLRLLCGADLLQSMTNEEVWKEEDIRAIIEDFGLIVVTRSGFDAQSIVDNHPILKKYSFNIIMNENTIGFEDSSTKVRQAIKESKEPQIDMIHKLIHKSVYDYIIKNGLYRE